MDDQKFSQFPSLGLEELDDGYIGRIKALFPKVYEILNCQ